MSRLFQSSLRFDKTPCQDAYTGSFSFNGQLKAWDESTRDSEVAQRRVLSTGPDVVLPARRAIRVFDEVYLVGTPHTDTFRGMPIRKGYPASLADGLATLKSLGSLCTGQSGTTAYAGKAWLKDDAFTQQDSHLNPKHMFYLSVAETVSPGMTITLNGLMAVVRAVFDAPSGLRVAISDEMMAPNVETAGLEVRVFDPVLNQSTATTTSVTAVRMRWQSLFKYENTTTPAFAPGDQQVAVAKSVVTPTPGSVFILSDGRWTVASLEDNNDTWLCKVSRAG